MLSSLLSVGPADPWIAAAFLALAIALVWRARGRLIAWAMDPATSRVHGLSVGLWDLGVGTVGGLLLGWAMHTTGLVYVFAATVLPVLAARELAVSLSSVGWLSPCVGMVGSLLGLALGNRLDLPAGQTAAAALVCIAAAASTIGGVRRAFRPRG